MTKAKTGHSGRLRIGRLEVDLAAVHELAHTCRPETCGAVCCAEYAVHVTPEEMERLTGYMPLAAKRAKYLKAGREYRNVFDEEDDGTYLLDTNPAGVCAFSFTGPSGGAFCSLHAAALDLGQSPAEVKPECCFLWPLALSGGRRPLLSVHEDAYRFICNKKRRTRTGRLHRGVREIISGLFGDDVLAGVEAACGRLIEERK